MSRPPLYEDIKNGYYNTSEMRKIAIAIGNGTPIPDNATVCDIEQIRNEIEQSRYGLVNDGLDLALKIIDKYTKK